MLLTANSSNRNFMDILRVHGCKIIHDAWNHVLCRFEESTARDVLKTARTLAKMCTMSGASQSGSWRSRLGNMGVRGSPLCMFLQCKRRLVKARSDGKVMTKHLDTHTYISDQPVNRTTLVCSFGPFRVKNVD
jgi:hypothetical protein